MPSYVYQVTELANSIPVCELRMNNVFLFQRKFVQALSFLTTSRYYCATAAWNSYSPGRPTMLSTSAHSVRRPRCDLPLVLLMTQRYLPVQAHMTLYTFHVDSVVVYVAVPLHVRHNNSAECATFLAHFVEIRNLFISPPYLEPYQNAKKETCPVAKPINTPRMSSPL